MVHEVSGLVLVIMMVCLGVLVVTITGFSLVKLIESVMDYRK